MDRADLKREFEKREKEHEEWKAEVRAKQHQIYFGILNNTFSNLSVQHIIDFFAKNVLSIEVIKEDRFQSICNSRHQSLIANLSKPFKLTFSSLIEGDENIYTLVCEHDYSVYNAVTTIKILKGEEVVLPRIEGGISFKLHTYKENREPFERILGLKTSFHVDIFLSCLFSFVEMYLDLQEKDNGYLSFVSLAEIKRAIPNE